MYHQFYIWPSLGTGLSGNVTTTGMGVLPGTDGALGLPLNLRAIHCHGIAVQQ